MHLKMFNNWCAFSKAQVRSKLKVWIVLLFLIIVATNVSAFTQKSDSVGVERKKGRLFVLHKVSGGETLYSISRKYGAPMKDLLSANENISINDLAIGDTLRVPYTRKPAKQDEQKILAVHEVKPSETLFGISREYEVDVQEIKTWNNLGNQPLAIGQRLIIYDRADTTQHVENNPGEIIHIVKQGETLYSLSRTYKISVDQLIAWNNLSDASIDLGDALVVGKKQAPTGQPEENLESGHLTAQSAAGAETKPEVETPAKEEKKEVKAQRAEEKKEVKRYEKITEMGMAGPIEGKTDTKKYLALHRTAAVGTIIQIRNEMNNLSVFVRVVGKLPNTGVNEKINIRITQAAYESLGGINDRIPVEISYIP